MIHKNIFISNNKEVGKKCKKWALENLPKGFALVDDPIESDIFISVMYDKILKEKFISKRKCYNFHPAPLPNYAGVNTITWSLLNEESYHGITLCMIDAGIDTGDIVDIVKIPILNDTANTLYDKVIAEMFIFFKKHFINLLFQKYKTTKQDFNKRKIYKRCDLKKILNLTNYMKATYFPGKECPFFYDQDGNKITVSYTEIRRKK